MQTTRSACFSLQGVFSLKAKETHWGWGEGDRERWVRATMNLGDMSHRCHSLKTLPAVPVVCEEWRGKQQAFSCGGSDWEIGNGEGWKPNTLRKWAGAQILTEMLLALAKPGTSIPISSFLFSFFFSFLSSIKCSFYGIVNGTCQVWLFICWSPSPVLDLHGITALL